MISNWNIYSYVIVGLYFWNLYSINFTLHSMFHKNPTTLIMGKCHLLHTGRTRLCEAFKMVPQGWRKVIVKNVTNPPSDNCLEAIFPKKSWNWYLNQFFSNSFLIVSILKINMSTGRFEPTTSNETPLLQPAVTLTTKPFECWLPC